MKTRLLITGMAWSVLSVLYGQNPQIKRVLDQAGLKYSVVNGNFSLSYNIGNGRKQIVFIDSKTEAFGGQQIVPLWSVVFKGTSISKEQLALLLLFPYQKKIGGSEVAIEDDDIFGIYTIKVPMSGFTPTIASNLCSVIASIGDQMEESLMAGEPDKY
jgi:hypothetical protein